MIVENLLRDLMFEVPSDPTIKGVIIEKDTIEKNHPPKIKKSV